MAMNGPSEEAKARGRLAQERIRQEKYGNRKETEQRLEAVGILNRKSKAYHGRGSSEFTNPLRVNQTPNSSSMDILRAKGIAKAQEKALVKSMARRMPKPVYERTGASSPASMGSLVNYPIQQTSDVQKYKAISRQEEARQRQELGGFTQAELQNIVAEKQRQKEFKLAGPLLNQQYEQQSRRAEEQPQFIEEQRVLANQQASERYNQKTRQLAKNIERGRVTTKQALQEFQAPAQAMHNKAGKAFKSVAGAYGARYKMSKSLLAFSNAFGGTSRGGQSHPGRPKQVYVHRSPFTGKPIPAPLYYKEMRAFKNLQQNKAETIQTQRTRQYAQRGIPPQQMQQIQQQVQQQQVIRQMQMQRPQPQQYQQPYQTQPQPQMVQPQQLQQQAQQLPNGTVIPRGNSVWKFRRGIVGTEGGLMGRQQKVYGLPESFWN
jgi:hypothetical protein